MGPNRALFFIFLLKNVSGFYIFNGNKKGEIMKNNYLFTAKAVFIASLAFSATAVLAERPSGTPTCTFTGGAYYSSNNTLYLESFAQEGAVVKFDDDFVACANQGESGIKVVVQRDTPLKTNSTLVLPFGVTSDYECVRFYQIDNFGKRNGTWEAVGYNVKGDIDAYTPYIMVTDTHIDECAALTEIQFTPKSETFQKSPEGMPLNSSLYNQETQHVDFVLSGTYEYKKWEGTETKGIYGYAAKDKGTVSGGQFVKIGSGAYLPPLRAYLKYVGNDNAMYKKSSDNEKDFELPETIEVRLMDGDSTLSIGKLNPVTGEIQMDSRRFDLNGRAINGKPANHGVYVGKQKVVR